MAIKIIDGQGTGYSVGVTDSNQLKVNAEVQTEMHFHSSEEGTSFSWASTFATGGSNVEVIYIKNTDDKKLHLHGFLMGSTVAQVWTIFKVTSGTAAGTTITPVNLRLASGITKNNTSLGNAAVTGSLSGDTLYLATSPANETFTLDTEGALLLEKGDEIAITASANGTVYVTVWGHWGE